MGNIKDEDWVYLETFFNGLAEVREDLIDTYVENAKTCIQKDRGLSIPNCPIKVDFEVGPSWGELSDY